jgi:hypothetical protein
MAGSGLTCSPTLRPSVVVVRVRVHWIGTIQSWGIGLSGTAFPSASLASFLVVVAIGECFRAELLVVVHAGTG